MLTRRKESDTYLATVSRHRWSPQITMKMCVAFSRHCGLHQLKRPQCRLKATHFIHFHHDLWTSVMSTDSSQVDVALFPSF